MSQAAVLTTALVGLLHAGFFVLEAFLWTKPIGRRVFGTRAEFAQSTRALAANQGVYNAFLAAGCFLGLALGEEGRLLLNFSLVCAVVAGVVGAVTVSRTILVVQALPALLALVLNELSS